MTTRNTSDFYSGRATPADLARHRAELRARPEVLKLSVETSNLGYLAGTLRRQVADSPLRRRALGADMLLAEVETHLRHAAAHLNLAHQIMTARGPWREA